MSPCAHTRIASWMCLGLFLLVAGLAGGSASAQVTAYKLAVAEAAAEDADIAAFYRETGYAPLWTGEGELFRTRRTALIAALSEAGRHGLPASRYRPEALLQQMAAARTTRDLGLVEVALSAGFLRYARDIQTGVLIPSRVDPGIVREVPYRARIDYLRGLAGNPPQAYFRALPPATGEYRALMKEKFRLEALVRGGGWGPAVPAGTLKPGQGGAAVVALRNRLIAMGYMAPSAAPSYDAALQQAVQAFQAAHGLTPDGVAGESTLAEINAPAEQRLQAVVVAMERERWLNRDRGPRHVLVNQTDFTARIIDNGKVTFETRAVIGKNTGDRRSPEFSDEMEFMVVNPSWYVPRSIVTKEYLPKLRANPNAVGHIEITDSRGRRVNRSSVNFAQYSAKSFPFSMRQAPSERNALGLVKFMFPNKYNIYLHDTPQKDLFEREVRAFSHGCIRLADPFGFAYALLAPQTDDPEAYFHKVLDTGRETRVSLDRPVPIHIVYRTAFADPRGRVQFRRDVYGRDARIWEALSKAGVALDEVRS